MGKSTVQLRPLQVGDEQQIRAALGEFEQAGECFEFVFQYDHTQSFARYVEKINAWARGEESPEFDVPSSFFLAVVEDRIVGRISLRHRLTEYLFKYVGHVGYGVRPSERNKGYATAMLRALLPKAARLGLDSVLITCEAPNIKSQRVIEKVGGKYENTLQQAQSKPDIKRYWVDCRQD